VTHGIRIPAEDSVTDIPELICGLSNSINEERRGSVYGFDIFLIMCRASEGNLEKPTK